MTTVLSLRHASADAAVLRALYDIGDLDVPRQVTEHLMDRGLASPPFADAETWKILDRLARWHLIDIQDTGGRRGRVAVLLTLGQNAVTVLARSEDVVINGADSEFLGVPAQSVSASAEDGSGCAHCGHDSDIERHHIAPKHIFPDPDEWPQIPLCKACHAFWHRMIRRHR